MIYGNTDGQKLKKSSSVVQFAVPKKATFVEARKALNIKQNY